MLNKKCNSPSSVRHELESIRGTICLPETEETWDKIAKAMQDLTYLCTDGGACNFPDELVPCVRSFSRPLNSAMASERTRLSGAAIDSVCALVSGLNTEFEPLLPLFLPTVLALCTRTNKVFAKRANACLVAIIEATQLPSILPYLLDGAKDKAATLRLAATEGVLVCLNCFNPPDLEKEARAREVEAVIRATVRDANVDVRKASRKIFEAYKILLPHRVSSFVAPLTPTTKKYLDVKALSNKDLSARPALSHARSTPANLDRSQPASSTTVQRLTTESAASHTRSTSSSAILTKKGDPAAQATSHLRREMPPPDFIPVRAAQAPRPPSQAPRPPSQTSSRPPSRPPSRPVSVISSHSNDGPVRPKSVTDAHPTQSSVGAPSRLARSQPPSSAPRRGDAPLNPQATVKAGPMRVATVPHAVDKAAVTAPSQERAKGGARRVPMPPSNVKEASAGGDKGKAKDSDVSKEKMATSSRPQRQRTFSHSAKSTPAIVMTKKPESSSKSTTNTANTSQSGTGRQHVPAAETTRDNEKAKPVPLACTSATASSDISKKAPVSSAPPAATRGGATQPTLSQLAKMTARPLVPRKAAESAKPGWGRSAPTVTRKASAPTLRTQASKALLKSKGSVVVKSNSLDQVSKKDVAGSTKAIPAMVPLPPSPVQESVEEDDAEEERETEVVERETEVVEAESGPRSGEVECSENTNIAEINGVDTASNSSSATEVERPLTPVAPNPPARSESYTSWLMPATTSENSTRTPISALVSSIQRGFIFSPCTPLSPPQSYLGLPPPSGPGLAPGLAGMKFTSQAESAVADEKREALIPVVDNQ